ncbi:MULTISPECIES: tyrosine-type recombinase/integrase [unclassified Marinovum]|uniref:tyrosine-type recombinase/integrase n=1 Tax=unclassified Marinovum TaxID=2647166 RepID=UPI003EDB8BD4
MRGFEVVTCDVEHQGVVRTVKMIRDADTLEPYFPASIWLMNEYHRKPRGYDQLAHHIANFFSFSKSKGVEPLEVDVYFLEAYCDKYLFQEKRLEASTVGHYHGSIAMFYKAMEHLGFIEKTIEVSEYINRSLQESIDLAAGIKNSLDPFDLYAKYLTHEDFETLSGYVSKKSARLRRRDELILRVAYETGCRGAEIVDPDNFSIRRIKSAVKEAEECRKSEFLYAIIGKGRGAGKVRKIAFPTMLAKDILRYVQSFRVPGDIAFGSVRNKRLSSSYPSKIYKACKDAILLYGNENTPNLDLWIRHSQTRTFHGLRHTYATNLANKLRALNESYEQLRERMGHESLDTTKIYVNFEILLHGSSVDQNAAMADHVQNVSPECYDEFTEKLE